MEIIHERPSQRLHYRVTAPMRVTVGGETFDAVDWGLGGCRVSGHSVKPSDIHTEHVLHCTLPFQGFNITLKAEAEIVRINEEKSEVAFRFTQLGERETALMQHFVEDLVRGKMTDVADTIVRIDTPVTPVPTKPDPNPAKHVPMRRWPVKQIFMTAFYLLLGIAVFGYVGIYAFATLFRLEVETAVVTAQRVQITAPVSGRILELPRQTNAPVSIGDTLAVMENTSHEAELRRAASVRASTRAQLAEMKSLLSEEQKRADGYTLVARNNVRQAQSQMAGLELAQENAQMKLTRMQNLAERGLVVADDLAEAELELKSVTSDLQRKQIHIQELNELIDGGDSIRLFTGNAFAGRIAEVSAKVERLTAELKHQDHLVDELSKREARQIVPSPVEGRIVSTEFVPGTVLKLGEPVMTLEETGSETVTAYLTQEEVQQVRIGSSANLYFPNQDLWAKAHVVTVDRTAGFIDEVTETYRFRAPDARSATVSLTSEQVDLPGSGTPVVVYFQRYRSNRVWRSLDQFREAF
ncbi:MAG: HlyD family efflux transporter periplasmic adaptor subunit [Pseudomonadota bacterium]